MPSDYVKPHPPMAKEESGWADGTLQLVGGYLRPRKFALDTFVGKTPLLNTEGYPEPKGYKGAETKSAAEIKDIFMNTNAEFVKNRKEARDKKLAAEGGRKRSLSTDPKEWLKAPWRSAHDGTSPSISCKWKWNNQKPMEEMRQWTMYDSTLRKNKPHHPMASTYGASYTDLKMYKPQTPQNMAPVPNQPLWQRSEPLVNQQRMFRPGDRYDQPPMTILKWAHLKNRCAGNGASM